eukprot:1915548-Amphidinium_carterae.1
MHARTRKTDRTVRVTVKALSPLPICFTQTCRLEQAAKSQQQHNSNDDSIPIRQICPRGVKPQTSEWKMDAALDAFQANASR